ncbi:RB binding protein 6, ubiquitin ligase [Rhinolophus ferrumequinum]|uniref:RB binding protein 6, ubiquitin ligase n=1 Tax=Rhinolophus ferrumequinum TaxID=59479 RepID=A0A7J7R8Q3_RHIFE|nr:RB binding protein 6, ubiquitin ligase [Rhinolophus ferrumequinum]
MLKRWIGPQKKTKLPQLPRPKKSNSTEKLVKRLEVQKMYPMQKNPLKNWSQRPAELNKKKAKERSGERRPARKVPAPRLWTTPVRVPREAVL